MYSKITKTSTAYRMLNITMDQASKLAEYKIMNVLKCYSEVLSAAVPRLIIHETNSQIVLNQNLYICILASFSKVWHHKVLSIPQIIISLGVRNHLKLI